MNESLCCFLLCNRVTIHTLCTGFSDDTDLVSLVTRRAASFFVRTVVEWNQLDTEVVRAETVESFRDALTRCY